MNCTKSQICEIMGLVSINIQKDQDEINSLAKNQPVSENKHLDCNVVTGTLGLDCNIMIQANFRRICMESSEQNIAYILLPFCTNRLIFSK